MTSSFHQILRDDERAAERTVSVCSKVNDTQSRNGRIITRLAPFAHVNFCALLMPISVVYFASLSDSPFLRIASHILALFTDYVFGAHSSLRACVVASFYLFNFFGDIISPHRHYYFVGYSLRILFHLDYFARARAKTRYISSELW